MRSKITGQRKERVRNKRDPRYLAAQRRYMMTLGKFLRRGRLSRIQIKELSAKSSVWKSTFYDHFAHMDDAIEQYWHTMEPEIKELFKEANRHSPTLSIIYVQILLLIYHNREYYDTILSCNNWIALREIVEIFKPYVIYGWSKYEPETFERAFVIFSLEFAGEIYFWGKNEKFNFDRIGFHAKALAKLSENATQRLA